MSAAVRASYDVRSAARSNVKVSSSGPASCAPNLLVPIHTRASTLDESREDGTGAVTTTWSRSTSAIDTSSSATNETSFSAVAVEAAVPVTLADSAVVDRITSRRALAPVATPSFRFASLATSADRCHGSPLRPKRDVGSNVAGRETASVCTPRPLVARTIATYTDPSVSDDSSRSQLPVSKSEYSASTHEVHESARPESIAKSGAKLDEVRCHSKESTDGDHVILA
mmetsp:Transcript_4076/g.13279  ORF Transcript_4076/g.13279 Transcript_4076/m.13279 type:complete len:227 (+) Transcript_4076:212-892(+)